MAMQNIDLKIVSEGKYIRQCSGHDHFGHKGERETVAVTAQFPFPARAAPIKS